ncbi:MAG: recombinase family protein [Defluviitaleaceae bacterium]|nr:recombinase family protein [Defluviitaleaceae bacterium]MCL2263374.1 recombinase family protein [Defluviitaleaceae bacterium]
MREPHKDVLYQHKLDNKITALYCRLSKEEAERAESLSIENQRKILLKFCTDNGFKNPKVFADDGETGVFFDRPGLNEMLAEIRAGNVSTVIIKDQSRIGREVIEIGLLKRTFDEYNVRFMSAEDGLDTAKGFDIMSLLRDVFNEWFVADTSRKIRAVQRTKGLSGEPLTSHAPYGYKKDPENPKRWVVDDVSAKVVRQIFKYAMEGMGVSHIADKLREEQVEIPTVYAYNAGYIKGNCTLDPYDWHQTTVAKVLERREYLGELINFKTYTKSYKNRKQQKSDPSDYAVFENAHPAIIDEDVFDRVQKIRSSGKRRHNHSGRVSMLSGLVYCADCKSKLYLSSGACLKPEQDNYVCSGFRTKKKRCESAHFIRRVVLEQAVLKYIQEVTAFASRHDGIFVTMLEAQNADRLKRDSVADKKTLAQSEKRIRELDKIIQSLYEDKVSGIIPEERFVMMSQVYELEQQGLKATVDALQAQIAKQLEASEGVGKFLKQVRKYTQITELSTIMLNELIERVEVHARTKRYSKGSQQIDVHFNYVGIIGKLDLPSIQTTGMQTQAYAPKAKQLEKVHAMDRIPVMSTERK